MATPNPLDAQQFGASLVTLAGLTLGTAPKTPTPVPGVDRDPLKPATVTSRGGWDGNSNEPLLADDLA